MAKLFAAISAALMVSSLIAFGAMAKSNVVAGARSGQKATYTYATSNKQKKGTHVYGHVR